jgi:hypothetical protein
MTTVPPYQAGLAVVPHGIFAMRKIAWCNEHRGLRFDEVTATAKRSMAEAVGIRGFPRGLNPTTSSQCKRP